MYDEMSVYCGRRGRGEGGGERKGERAKLSIYNYLSAEV